MFYSAATPAERARARATDRLTGQTLAALAVPPAATAYVCGSASFMADVRQALIAAGLAPAAICTELFGALPPINPGLRGLASRPLYQPLGHPGAAPLVTFARSGITVPFATGQHSVLDLADPCDVPTRWS